MCKPNEREIALARRIIGQIRYFYPTVAVLSDDKRDDYVADEIAKLIAKDGAELTAPRPTEGDVATAERIIRVNFTLPDNEELPGWGYRLRDKIAAALSTVTENLAAWGLEVIRTAESLMADYFASGGNPSQETQEAYKNACKEFRALVYDEEAGDG